MNRMGPRHKRRRSNSYTCQGSPGPSDWRHDADTLPVPFPDPDDALGDFRLQSLQAIDNTTSNTGDDQAWDMVRSSSKRTLEDDAEHDFANLLAQNNNELPDGWPRDDVNFIKQSHFPGLLPGVHIVPNSAFYTTGNAVPNPFNDDFAKPRHPLPPKPGKPVRNHAANGYIKYRILPAENHIESHNPRFRGSRFNNSAQRKQPYLPWLCYIPSLPRDFGRGLQLEGDDRKVLQFFLVGYCKGRTLLPKHNLWLRDIAPMISRSECVKHSLLSFASGYILDLFPMESVQKRANHHYQRAIALLSDALRDVNRHRPGKEEDTIASLMLLLGVDIVFWELRYAPGRDPRWFTAARTAKSLLDSSNPGYQYNLPEHVQHSDARLSCSNWTAFVNIVADVVIPFSKLEDEPFYPWLVSGDRMATKRIHGGTGASPKLLHILSQITFLSKRLSEEADNLAILIVAESIEKRLSEFLQWSELSAGCSDLDELIQTCQSHLHPETGKVNDAGKLTDLIGHAWIAAAQIYLQCRLYRRPRAHPAVKEALRKLITCIDLQPFSGDLFTAQSPFFAIFMMALVAIDEDRQVSIHWFETVCAEAGDRSSVPPLWRSLQRIWAWMDNQVDGEEPLKEDEVIENRHDEKQLAQRAPWWEQMVDWTWRNEGILSLV